MTKSQIRNFIERVHAYVPDLGYETKESIGGADRFRVLIGGASVRTELDAELFLAGLVLAFERKLSPDRETLLANLTRALARVEELCELLDKRVSGREHAISAALRTAIREELAKSIVRAA